MHKYLIKQGLLTLRIDVVATLCIIFLICIKIGKETMFLAKLIVSPVPTPKKRYRLDDMKADFL
jgi:hypothetical protein